ncbi:hypothetical protein FEZ33_09400 [Ruoffia tabacinasalis]|uniref:Uncharacterized protein n=1 Tax=Ruoffia tabacinasalis TaxID=87458 RepID=A0A5R9DXM0_9LACT|nr:hypothetical protein FEZ33_09400 [Ruoffia tabacinasalis]
MFTPNLEVDIIKIVHKGLEYGMMQVIAEG